MKPYAKFLEELIKESDVEGLKSVVEINERGVSGEQTNTMVARLDGELSGDQYDLVILLAGTNDVGTRKGADEVFDRLQQMYKAVAKHGARLCVLTLPENAIDADNAQYAWLEQARTALNDKIRAFAAADDNVILFDLDGAIPHGQRKGQEEMAKYWGDTLHFSEEGYKLFAEKLFAVLKESV